MYVSTADQTFCQLLREHGAKHGYRYGHEAKSSLLKILFHSLAGNNGRYLNYFFPHGLPESNNELWSLNKAQGAVDGAEYTEGARGKRCGHVFRNGEATYSCRTCTVDDTCVLCMKCFDASDHEGHQVSISMSGGTAGCCDCGDVEAWARPISCSIHTAIPGSSAVESSETPQTTSVPPDLQESMRLTISRTMDFLIDIFSCSLEHMRTAKTEQSIRQNEEMSRLRSKWYRGSDATEQISEFALLLWNDEKHTMDEVAEQVARACRKTRTMGARKAMEVDSVGRSILEYSKDLKSLITAAAILEQIKITVTIRSSRDTFREQMCGTIVEWLSDIAACSVGTDHHILMNIVCEEMLKPWRIGSEAFNLQIAKQGIADEEKFDERLARLRAIQLQRRLRMARDAATMARLEVQTAPAVTTPNGDDEDDDVELGGQDLEQVVDDVDAEMNVDDANEERTPGPTVLFLDNIDINPAAMIAPSPLQMQNNSEDSDEEPQPILTPQRDPNTLLGEIPQTPRLPDTKRVVAPGYWFPSHKSWSQNESSQSIAAHEDLHRRVRIDFLLLYDIRMWKQLRNNLRHLYISTIVTVPSFKRVLGLRFAALYTHLAQLYLIADREPDHSIISLSLQMLTTPSITMEVVNKGNFFSSLLAILYTFLTKRQVGRPEEVNPTAMMALDTGVMTNRRIYQFFSDMRYLLDSSFVQQKIRGEDEYLLQFLDFLKLFQGICPNIRAVGDHLEYESDAWISASFITKEVIRILRQFCESFRWSRGQDPAPLCRAIRQTAKATIINSLGAERERFTQAELKTETRFKLVRPYEFEARYAGGEGSAHTIVDFTVEKEPMSFHHTLHYTLSWLIDSGKSMSRDQLHGLLKFSQYQLQLQDPRSSTKPMIPLHDSSLYLLSLFDIPLRVCVWLSQMRAGMWVRNGITLRHQASAFKSVAQRDLSQQRDIFLLQVALVICNPSSILASIIERYGTSEWMRGITFEVPNGYEDHQIVDMLEDMLHLLIILLTDRNLLHAPEEVPTPDHLVAKRDVIHVLCFKPLSYSELTERLPYKVREMADITNIVKGITKYRAPEGLSDSGTFELKHECYQDVDPYYAYYSRNQREEAESIYRTRMAETSGQAADNIVYEAQLRPIQSGIFMNIADITRTPLFAHMISRSFNYVLAADISTPDIPLTRLEALLHTALHLALIAIREELSCPGIDSDVVYSFSGAAIVMKTEILKGKVETAEATILDQLFMLLDWAEFKNASQPCKAKIRLMIQRLQESNPELFLAVGRNIRDIYRYSSTTPHARDRATMKKQALDRQARVLASFRQQQNEFLEKQGQGWENVESSDSDLEMPQAYHSESQTAKKTWAFPTGTCIFCQEDTNNHRLYGTLGNMAESNILRSTDLTDQDYIEEVVTTPCNLDQSAETLRPFGVAGQNVQNLLRVAPDGSLNTSTRRGLGKGFPAAQHLRGPVTTGCGHLMHYSCFHAYSTAIERRHAYQVARNHPERLKLKEFVCPLCKALGNVFLPIIWKPKDAILPPTVKSSPLTPRTVFEQWLTMQAPFSVSQGISELNQLKKSLINNGIETLVPSLAVTVSNNLTRGSQIAALSHGGGSSMRWQLPSFLSSSEPGGTTLSRTNPATHSLNFGELLEAYARLSQTMTNNQFWSDFAPAQGDDGAELTHSATIATSLGFTISAVEIAQRGVEPGIKDYTGMFLAPQQTLTHLRILSETSSSYLAISSLQKLRNDTHINASNFHATGVSERSAKQLQQLFGGNGGLIPHTDASTLTPLLSCDLFVFLVECSVFCVPYVRLDICHIMRICYLAEIVKVIVAFLKDPDAAIAYVDSMRNRDGQTEDANSKQQCSAEESQNFSVFVQCILHQVRSTVNFRSTLNDDETNSNLSSVIENPNTRYILDRFLRSAVLSYALPFARKAAILLHIRYGVDFVSAEAAKPDTSELVRLSKALGLPLMDDIIRSFINGPCSEILQRLSSAWVTHWSSRKQNQAFEILQALNPKYVSKPVINLDIKLPHPAIYELVALPDTHDALNAEAMARRCPTTGRELSDPCICLFCGAVFCGQAACCAPKPTPATSTSAALSGGEGGCYRHQVDCAGSIGMYLNIRKCVVLLLNGRNGTFTTAPYLDKYGEVPDPGLRRKNQLFLNRKRFDKLLREVWLKGEVQSVISRKLEGDINTGGWETT